MISRAPVCRDRGLSSAAGRGIGMAMMKDSNPVVLMIKLVGEAIGIQL